MIPSSTTTISSCSRGVLVLDGNKRRGKNAGGRGRQQQQQQQRLSRLFAVTTTNDEEKTTTTTTTTSSGRSSSTTSSSLRETRQMIANMRRDLVDNNINNNNEEDPSDAQLLMQALRGQNLNDDDKAVEGLKMRLVDVGNIDDNIDYGGEGTAGVGTAGGVQSRISSLPYEYDPQALKLFFSRRPMVVFTRIIQITTTCGSFILNIIFDQLFKRYTSDPQLEIKRARQGRDLITSLGPFFIKIGQALSIRPDILSPRSMVELQKLCDKVPSYDSTIAYATIERELNDTITNIFSHITSEPVAAASLGQVYKATLRYNGDIVAVKVQRPAVLETVSLDLYLAREFGLLLRNYFPLLVQRIDFVSLLDEFAYRFYQELDYNLECMNGIRVQHDMRILPQVIIPQNYPNYTTRRIHVAQWINGEKLSQSQANDVSSLVNLGVVTYLTQLLDSGFFHADPHPGNMMRTEDGKLAILDFGLMTEITDDQKYGMIEAIAHLINRDYSSIGQDFINLDFIPKGTDTRPIVPALTTVFDVALAGGGAKSINFQELASDLAQITFDYPFRIPPYFALVIRAISVLEGIALVANPNFAIIDESFPYIARRLMTDPSPRLRAALRYMVYGREGVFNAENLIDLLQALEKFTAVRDDGDGTAFKVDGIRGSRDVGRAGDFSGSQQVDTSDRDTDVDGGRFRVSTSDHGSSADMITMNGSSSSMTNIGGVDKIDVNNDERTVRESLRFFFSDEGDVFREFMLEEIVTVVDASSRDALQELIRSIVPSSTTPAGELLRNILPRTPVPDFFKAMNPELTDEDRRMVQQIGKLVQFLLGDYEGSSAIVTNARLRKLIPVIREYSSELRDFGLLLVARLTEKSISRGMNWATKQLLAIEEGSTTSTSTTYR